MKKWYTCLVAKRTEQGQDQSQVGDYIAYFPLGHTWSDTEKESFSIVELEMDQDDIDRLFPPTLIATDE
jgi:hypothetical protein